MIPVTAPLAKRSENSRTTGLAKEKLMLRASSGVDPAAGFMFAFLSDAEGR